jgi:DNA uptake protein ComE-like DNA-binding protein
MLAALGVLVILGLLASVFLAHMHMETAYAARDAYNLKAHYLAVAAAEDVIARLRSDSPEVDAYSDAWWPGSSSEMIPLGDGGYTLTVSDESARINVLSASPEALNAVLGSNKEALAAIMNFRSSAKLFAVEDLGAAGIGADALTRAIALCTVLGDGRVNINTASADVIQALPGMDANAAQTLVEFRRGADGQEGTHDDFVFAFPDDLAKVPGLTPLRVAPSLPLVKVNSNFFRVEAVGSVHIGPRVVSSKRVVAVLERKDGQNVDIISWESS